MSLLIDSVRDAKVDLIDVAHYLSESEGMGAVTRFISAVKKACERLAEMPGIGTPRLWQSALRRDANDAHSKIPEILDFLSRGRRYIKDTAGSARGAGFAGDFRAGRRRITIKSGRTL